MDEFYRTLGALETREDALYEVSAARIAARMDAARRKTPGLKRRRLVVLIAAAALVLTACTAAVAHYTDWFSYLRPYGSEKNTEAMFGDMGMVIGETVTDGETGVSVTLDGCTLSAQSLSKLSESSESGSSGGPFPPGCGWTGPARAAPCPPPPAARRRGAGPGWGRRR